MRLDINHLKVLVIPEYSEYGGTLSFLKILLEINRNNNVESAVLIEKSKAYPKILLMFDELKNKVYIEKDRPNIFTKSYISIIYDLFFIWKAYNSFRPDIIVVSNGSPGSMLGSLIYNVPVIFIMHSYPTSKRRIGTNLFCKIMSLLKKNVFVTVSKFSAKNIEQFMFIPKEKIKVIYNSYQACFSETKKNEKENIVLTIGHVVSYKNPQIWLDVAIKVLSKIDNIKFVWVGDGELYKIMAEKVEKNNLENKIIFYGYSGNTQDFYSRSIIYFQPSLIESHGISVVEAMANGLPCITSNSGGLPESVVNGKTGFTCDPEDIETFVNKIIILCQNPELRLEMGNSGKVKALEIFSKNIQEKKILELYKNIIISN